MKNKNYGFPLIALLLLILSCQPQKDNIYHAIDFGQEKVIIKTLEIYPELIESEDKKESPLYYAVKNNAKEEILRLLIQKTESNYRIQFLSFTYALTNDFFEICDVFIEEGFDVNENYYENENEGLYVIGCIRYDNQINQLEYLIKNNIVINNKNAVTPPLKVAIISNSPELAKRFIMLRADINDTGIYEETTPIIDAAFHHRYEICKLLLEAGADPNDETGGLRTPIMYSQDKKTLQLFIDYGADIHSINDNNWNVLAYFLLNFTNNNFYINRVQVNPENPELLKEFQECLDIFLLNKVSFNLQTKEGMRPLDIATEYYFPDKYLELLKSYGAHY